MDDYLRLMAWWNTKTPEQKLAFVGVETLDKWVDEIARKQLLVSQITENNAKMDLTSVGVQGIVPLVAPAMN